MFLCISQCDFWLCRRCEGCQGLHRSEDVLTAVQAVTGLGQGMSPAWPRHCWSSLPFLLSAWQLPLLSPLPWQCQPRSHGVSACASARQTRSHAGLEPRSHHCPRSRMATAQAGGLTQPQNSVGMEMDMSPHPRGEVWVGSRGRRRGLHLEYLPGLPPQRVQPGALHHNRTPVPHSHPGFSHSSPVLVSAHGPKSHINQHPAALILKCLTAAAGV